MREDEVPQDRSFYKGLERVCFAVGKDQRYVPAKSAGWEVERIATEQALVQLEEELETIRQGVLAGRLAPLAYHIATRQMTPKLFARHVGLSTWRIKRHLQPRRFARLPPAQLALYARCLDLPVEALHEVPAESRSVFFEESGD